MSAPGQQYMCFNLTKYMAMKEKPIKQLNKVA